MMINISLGKMLSGAYSVDLFLKHPELLISNISVHSQLLLPPHANNE